MKLKNEDSVRFDDGGAERAVAATSRDLDLDCLVQALEQSIRIPCFNPGSFIIEDVPIAQ